jgi:hypothetical protein
MLQVSNQLLPKGYQHRDAVDVEIALGAKAADNKFAVAELVANLLQERGRLLGSAGAGGAPTEAVIAWASSLSLLNSACCASASCARALEQASRRRDAPGGARHRGRYPQSHGPSVSYVVTCIGSSQAQGAPFVVPAANMVSRERQSARSIVQRERGAPTKGAPRLQRVKSTKGVHP